MKQLLFIIITFMFVSNLYAEKIVEMSAETAEIIGKDEVLHSGETTIDGKGYTKYYKTILYNNKEYSCRILEKSEYQKA